jgi:hypothetical protein
MPVSAFAGAFQPVSVGVGLPFPQAFLSSDASGAPQPVTNPPVTVGAGVNGAVLVILGLVVSVDTTMVVTFTEETSGTVVAEVILAANTTVQLGRRTLYTPGKRLMVQTSAPGNIAVTANYYSQPAAAA